jgi:DNA-binding transcriptional regulator YiaG
MEDELEYPRPAARGKHAWDARRIRALREYLKLTQSQMAEELQVRQQTISEWETGEHIPHRSTQKILSMVAERAGFTYDAAARPAPEGKSTDSSSS